MFFNNIKPLKTHKKTKQTTIIVFPYQSTLQQNFMFRKRFIVYNFPQKKKEFKRTPFYIFN